MLASVNRTARPLALALLTLLAGCARVDTPVAAPDADSVAVQCGALIDGLADRATGPATVVIRDGRIAAIEPGRQRPAALPVVDLTGYTCLPGLIDLHVHITEEPESMLDLTVYYRRSVADAVALGRVFAERTLNAGFTTVRNVGNYIAWADRALRDEIDAGRTPGPRMQVVGYYLTIPGGGGEIVFADRPDVEIPAHVRQGVARGADAFRAKAGAAVAGGATALKVIASGAVLAPGGQPGAVEMTVEEIRAVTEVGHAHGLKVTAHAHGAQSVRDAIEAGVDSIEHASLIDDAGIALARERGVALVMDVYNGDYIDTEGRRMGWAAEYLRNNTDTTEVQRQRFTQAHAAGVVIGYGTDAGVFPHGDNARQFPIMVERGMTAMEAIRSATSVAARILGWEDRVGAVVPGRYGDLIAVLGDPLADISRLQDVAVVIKGGLVVKSPPQ
jgi:imidazolonepropionase-like amidohydrolase